MGNIIIILKMGSLGILPIIPNKWLFHWAINGDIPNIFRSKPTSVLAPLVTHTAWVESIRIPGSDETLGFPNRCSVLSTCHPFLRGRDGSHFHLRWRVGIQQPQQWGFHGFEGYEDCTMDPWIHGSMASSNSWMKHSNIDIKADKAATSGEQCLDVLVVPPCRGFLGWTIFHAPKSHHHASNGSKHGGIRISTRQFRHFINISSHRISIFRPMLSIIFRKNAMNG